MNDIIWNITYADDQGESSMYYNAPTKDMAIKLFSFEYYNYNFISIQ
jgi:hypothetical protein